jgi:Transposase IS66 family
LARERLCLAAQFRGEGTLEHMGITGVTAPGQLNLIDATSESDHVWTGLATRRIFFVHYAVLGLPVDLVRAAAGRLPASPFYQLGALVPEQPATGPRGASGDSARSRVRRYLDRACPRSGSHQLTDNATSSLDSPSQRSKALNLLMRLDTQRDGVLRFATGFSVPFDDNLCERDVRMVKIARKISGGFRSTEGAEHFLAFRSYLWTAARQGVDRLDALQGLSNRNPWMPAAPQTAH